MGAGVLYANANIMMQADAFLLTRERIRKMTATDNREELLRILEDCGYDTDFESDDQILDAERQKTLDTFVHLCDDEAIINCIKELYRVTELTIEMAFENIAKEIPNIKCRTIRNYFITLADLTNVRTFYKGGTTFVKGGNFEPSSLNIFPDMDNTQIEDEINKRLDNIACTDKDDIFLPNPLFWWYMEKQKEFIAVKTILMCKRFGFDASIIRENLRGLYERFK